MGGEESKEGASAFFCNNNVPMTTQFVFKHVKKKILISLEAVEKVFLYEGTYVWVGHVISSLEPIAQNDI